MSIKMRLLNALMTLVLIAMVAAQSATNATHTSTRSTSSVSSSPSLTAQVRCLQQCGSADVCCQAKCVNVPCPSQSQANATDTCEANCPQGNGTAADIDAYAQCQASCVSSYFLPSTTTAAATASGGSRSSATTTGSSRSSRSTASSTVGPASASPTSKSGATDMRVGTMALGFLGLVVAGMAL